MSTLSIRLPRSLHEEIKALAHKEGVSMNQFIMMHFRCKYVKKDRFQRKKRALFGSPDRTVFEPWVRKKLAQIYQLRVLLAAWGHHG